MNQDKKFSINLIKLINTISLKGINKKKLKFIPEGSNFLIENIITNNSIIRNIVEIYPHFYPSQTQLKNYFKIQNISKECFLQLSYIQYKYLDDLFAK